MHTALMLVIAIFVALGTGHSFAAEPGSKYLTLWGVSYHADRSNKNCEFNYGVGYQQFISRHIYYAGGIYRNSPCNMAPYAKIGYEVDVIGNRIGVGVFGGLVGGYTEDNFSSYPLMPALPYIRLGDPANDWHIKWIIIPSNDPITAAVVNLRLDNNIQSTSSINIRAQSDNRNQDGYHVTATWTLNF